MKNKLAVALICATLLLAAGCPAVENSASEETQPLTYITTDVRGFPKVEEGYGLYGATVTIDGVYPGWSGGAPVTIVNGNDQARVFRLSLQQPGESLGVGYEPFPVEYFGWIAIGDVSPWVAAGYTGEIPVTLSIPKNMPDELKGKSYEVRILVEDWSQSGFVQLALQEKWLITFAE